MTRNEIMEILPHREPMLLIDEGELADGVSVCKYTVRGDEFFLRGHFPENPVVPGVIQCEMMAQAACLLFAGASPQAAWASSSAPAERPAPHPHELFEKSSTKTLTPFLTGMEKVRFKKKVVPNDTIVLKVELVKQKGAFFFVKGAGYVNEKMCCAAEISFALMEA